MILVKLTVLGHLIFFWVYCFCHLLQLVFSRWWWWKQSKLYWWEYWLKSIDVFEQVLCFLRARIKTLSVYVMSWTSFPQNKTVSFNYFKCNCAIKIEKSMGRDCNVLFCDGQILVSQRLENMSGYKCRKRHTDKQVSKQWHSLYWWCMCDGIPRRLCVTVVDVLCHGVVIKQILKFPFEIRAKSVH